MEFRGSAVRFVEVVPVILGALCVILGKARGYTFFVGTFGNYPAKVEAPGIFSSQRCLEDVTTPIVL
jgi:hypothetical protein